MPYMEKKVKSMDRVGPNLICCNLGDRQKSWQFFPGNHVTWFKKKKKKRAFFVFYLEN